MAIRAATVADAPLYTSLLQEYMRQIGSSDVIDQARISRRINRWPLVHAIDDAFGVACELKALESEQSAEFTGAFPRGASRALIGPVMAQCARQLLLHYPTGQRRGVREWRVWGHFMHGETSVRVRDGGREICDAWKDYFAVSGREVTVRGDSGGLWIAEMNLGVLADHV